MVVDDLRARARAELERAGLSVETASYLVDGRPPAGWESLVTHDQLRAELADVRLQIAGLGTDLRQEMRDQTRWVATAIIGAMSASIAAMAIIGAALRFA